MLGWLQLSVHCEHQEWFACQRQTHLIDRKHLNTVWYHCMQPPTPFKWNFLSISFYLHMGQYPGHWKARLLPYDLSCCFVLQRVVNIFYESVVINSILFARGNEKGVVGVADQQTAPPGNLLLTLINPKPLQLVYQCSYLNPVGDYSRTTLKIAVVAHLYLLPYQTHHRHTWYGHLPISHTQGYRIVAEK